MVLVQLLHLYFSLGQPLFLAKRILPPLLMRFSLKAPFYSLEFFVFLVRFLVLVIFFFLILVEMETFPKYLALVYWLFLFVYLLNNLGLNRKMNYSFLLLVYFSHCSSNWNDPIFLY